MTTTTVAAASRPIEDMESAGLLEQFAEGPRLVGTVCNECATTMLDVRVVCSSCISSDVARVALPTTGVLYTFTRLHVGAEGVRLMGYVDLDDDVRTLADLQESELSLTPGMRVELAVDGDTWYFTPVSGQ